MGELLSGSERSPCAQVERPLRAGVPKVEACSGPPEVAADGRPEAPRGEAGSKIWLLTWGTRGDVQPFLPLGLALQAAGHDVRVFAMSFFENMFTSYGLPFEPLDKERLAEAMRTDFRLTAHLFEEAELDCPDMVMYFHLMVRPALALAAKFGAIPVQTLTFMSHSHLMPPILFYMSMAWKEDVVSAFGSSPLDDMGIAGYAEIFQGKRQVVGVSPLMFDHGLSRNEIIDGIADNMELREHVRRCYTGCWALPAERQLQAGDRKVFGGDQTKMQVSDFIRAGDALPVYMGWGSMGHAGGPKRLASLVVKSLKLAMCRGIFVAGWSGLTLDVFKEALEEEDEHWGYAYPDSLAKYAEEEVLFLEAAPHEWVFPQCACNVHHGGAGTTQAALRAGVPTIVVPVTVDQPWNGEWVEKLGCGKVTKSLHEVVPEDLSEALRAVLDDGGIGAKAREVAERMRAEPGVAGAVEIVNEILTAPHEVDEPGLHPSGREATCGEPEPPGLTMRWWIASAALLFAAAAAPAIAGLSPQGLVAVQSLAL